MLHCTKLCIVILSLSQHDLNSVQRDVSFVCKIVYRGAPKVLYSSKNVQII